MVKIDFNADWLYRRLGSDGEGHAVTLPHDATKEAAFSSNGAVFDGEYTKRFFLPTEYADRPLFFEFEGVYRNVEVYINGQSALDRPYGYTGFFFRADSLLKCGEENEIKVIARAVGGKNSDCVGICCPVFLFVLEKEHIFLNGIRIRTLQIHPAVVEVAVRTSCPGEVGVEFLFEGEVVFFEKILNEGDEAVIRANVPYAALWSPENPSLYTCRVTFGTDVREETFGIRVVACHADVGFTLNGERIVLRGACLSAGNGILGGCAFPEAEERKIRMLKSGGYNVVRCAHTPCSRAMIEACDRLGMLVADECANTSYLREGLPNDAAQIGKWQKRDLIRMIEKDYNHPSVVMYSLGNELTDRGEKQYPEYVERGKEVFSVFDPDRPVTVGVNLALNYFHAFSEEWKPKVELLKRFGVFLSRLAGVFGTDFLNFLALLPGCERKAEGYYAAADVAGYNYGIKRYRKDLEKYPDRMIVGSESFCADGYAFREIARDNPRLIGDFVRTEIDCLGGVNGRKDAQRNVGFLRESGWLDAGKGRFDFIGTVSDETLYGKVAFEEEYRPMIVAAPVVRGKGRNFFRWKKETPLFPSWSWSGREGEDMRVEVYSRSPQIALYVNGVLVGKKKRKKDCRVSFRVKYHNGEILALALDNAGKEVASHSINSAGEETCLSIMPERMEVRPGQIAFIPLKYTDRDYIWKPLENGTVQIEVEGGELLAVGNSRVQSDDCRVETYCGAAMIVARATGKKLIVSATDGYRTGRAEIIVRERRNRRG